MRLLLVLLLTVPCAAEEIPLSEVWSNGMPTTKDIRELEPDFDGRGLSDEESRKRSSFYRLSFCLSKRVGKSPGEIAIVPGQGRKALSHVADVICAKQRFQLQPGEEATIGFYTGMTANDITITGIEQNNDVVTLQIKITPRATANLSAFTALIPVTLPKGDRMEIRYAIYRPDTTHFKPADASRRRCCVLPVACNWNHHEIRRPHRCTADRA